MPQIEKTSKTSHRQIAAACVLVVIGVAALLARMRTADESTTAETTADSADATIERMLSHGRAGDLDAWLGCFSGQAREQLDSQIAATGQERFAARLQAKSISMQSFVTSEWQIADTQAVVQLEKVFTDRNEKWRLTLQESGSGWVIVKQTPLEDFAPEIPHGTPVVPETD